MRLDVYVSDKGFYESRTRAVRAIKESLVIVNGKPCTKPAFEINSETDAVECLPDPVPYVGRGALKLEFALDKYSINVNNCKAVDIGASTGGFTDVLLQRGAAHVACVDVGHGQLADKIRNDERTSVFEDTDIRDFNVDEGTYDIACTDVSFISIKLIIPHIFRLLKEDGTAVCLIKPQYELGRKALNKKGIIKDKRLAEKCAEEIKESLALSGLMPFGLSESPIKGGDGNTEFICVCKRYGLNSRIDV